MGLKVRTTQVAEPTVLTESEADVRFALGKKLSSGGTYGCHVLVIDANHPSVSSRNYWMCDEHFRALWDTYSEKDVGTIVIDGDLTLTHAASISDRLMCLVVTGNLAATDFHVYATEVAIFGDFSAKLLTDHDGYLRAQGKTTLDKIATYE